MKKQVDTVTSKYKGVKKHYDAIDKYNDNAIKICQRMIKGNNYPLFITDMLMIGIVKRCIDLNDGIATLSNNWNFIASAPLLRLQLDSLLRLNYLREINFADDFCIEIIKEKSFKDLKDFEGKLLSDARLKDYSRKKYPWIDKLYLELSKHIHFSDKHMMLTIDSVDPSNQTSTFFVGKGNKRWPEEEVVAFLSATARIMREILIIVELWVSSKEHKLGDKRIWKVK